MLRCSRLRLSSRIMMAAAAFIACACLAWPGRSYGEYRTTHLYVLLGFANMSPGLAEFGAKIRRLGVPTTVSSYADWQTLALQAIQQYKRGRLRSIEIVGHSFGGAAGMAMAAELGRAGVPVELLVTIAPVGGGSKASSNVRRWVNILPKGGENHYSVIAAHKRDLRRYVLGGN
jgi:pimeloyl-ACP methyl ester carboxylesterase